LVRLTYLSEDFFGCGIDRLKHLAAGGVNKLAIDK
jgi:hypothetical protein